MSTKTNLHNLPLILFKTLSEDHCILVDEIDYSRELILFQFLKENQINLDGLDQITNINRRIEWMSVRYLLLKYFQNFVDIQYDEHNKPHLINQSETVSISHSHERIAISLNKNENQSNGIDIQQMSPSISRIKNKFMHPNELGALDELDSEDLNICWSVKEALFKVHGKKDIYLKENIKILSFDRSRRTAKAQIQTDTSQTEYHLQFEIIDDYTLAYTCNC